MIKSDRFFYAVAFVFSITSMMFGDSHSGYHIAALNNLEEQTSDSTFWYIIYSFLVPAGAVFGSFLGSYISSNKGRISTFYFCQILNFLGSLLSAIVLILFHNESSIYKALFALGRILCGLNAGISAFIVPLYSKYQVVRQITPQKLKSKLGTINQFMITLGKNYPGILLAYSISYMSVQFLNRVSITFFFPISFSIIQWLFMIFWFHQETPTFLWQKNQTQQAVEVLNKLYFTSTDKLSVRDLLEDSTSNMQNQIVTWNFRMLFTNPQRFNILKKAMTISILQQFTGINMIIINSTLLLSKYESQEIEFSTILLGIINWISSSLVIFILDCKIQKGVGNKKMLKIGSFGMGFCYIGMIFLTIFQTVWTYFFFVIILMLFIVFFELSIGPIMWIYCADHLSDKGVAITTSTNWLTATIVNVTTIIMIEYYGMQYFIIFYGIYLAFCIKLYVVSEYYLIDPYKNQPSLISLP